MADLCASNPLNAFEQARLDRIAENRRRLGELSGVLCAQERSIDRGVYGNSSSWRGASLTLLPALLLGMQRPAVSWSLPRIWQRASSRQ
jgi:hypothetical protein